MASIRLRQDQIDRLRASGNASAVIRYAVKRFARGDIVIDNAEKLEITGNILQVFPIYAKIPGVSDRQIRAILDANWAHPDVELEQQCDREIAKLDQEISEMMKCLPPVIVEDNND